MRIAMVVTGGLHPTGREQVVPSLLALFSRLARSHEVHAFALRHLTEPTSYDLLGFTVHDLGRPSALLGLRRRAQERALRRAMAAHGPFDLVHGFWGDPAGLLAARAGGHFGIPSVVTCDSGEFVAIPEIDYGSQRSAKGRSAVRSACSLATSVHVCTDYMSRLASQHGVQTVTIPLGIEGAKSAKSAKGAARLLQVAGLSRVKNQRLAIEAVAILVTRLDVHLDLVGEDTMNGALQALARERGLADRVVFHGFVPQDEITPLYGRASLYVQTSLHEAAGVSVLEAASVGVPVVGTRVGYIADWAPRRAVAIDEQTPEALAETIEELLCNPDRGQAVAFSAQTWVLEHDADWTAAEIERLYRVRRVA